MLTELVRDKQVARVMVWLNYRAFCCSCCAFLFTICLVLMCEDFRSMILTSLQPPTLPSAPGHSRASSPAPWARWAFFALSCFLFSLSLSPSLPLVPRDRVCYMAGNRARHGSLRIVCSTRWMYSKNTHPEDTSWREARETWMGATAVAAQHFLLVRVVRFSCSACILVAGECLRRCRLPDRSWCWRSLGDGDQSVLAKNQIINGFARIPNIQILPSNHLHGRTTNMKKNN